MMNEFRDHWRKESDEIPDDDRMVLICICDFDMIEQAEETVLTIGYFDGERWKDTFGDPVVVTHWMELPDLPKEEDE